MRLRRNAWLLVAVVVLGLWQVWQQRAQPPAPVAETPTTLPAPSTPGRGYPAFLPREAHALLDQIARGGPYRYRQDGGTFQNRERRLPNKPRGWYREFTVTTPGSKDRGARRIVTGGDPPVEYWYSDDHYRSFRRFEVKP